MFSNLLDWLLNSWVGLLLIAAVPIILFNLSSTTSRKMRKDIDENPYDHRNNPPPPPPGGGLF